MAVCLAVRWFLRNSPRLLEIPPSSLRSDSAKSSVGDGGDLFGFFLPDDFALRFVAVCLAVRWFLRNSRRLLEIPPSSLRSDSAKSSDHP